MPRNLAARSVLRAQPRFARGALASPSCETASSIGTLTLIIRSVYVQEFVSNKTPANKCKSPVLKLFTQRKRNIHKKTRALLIKVKAPIIHPTPFTYVCTSIGHLYTSTTGLCTWQPCTPQLLGKSAWIEKCLHLEL